MKLNKSLPSIQSNKKWASKLPVLIALWLPVTGWLSPFISVNPRHLRHPAHPHLLLSWQKLRAQEKWEHYEITSHACVPMMYSCVCIVHVWMVSIVQYASEYLTLLIEITSGYEWEQWRRGFWGREEKEEKEKERKETQKTQIKWNRVWSTSHDCICNVHAVYVRYYNDGM